MNEKQVSGVEKASSLYRDMEHRSTGCCSVLGRFGVGVGDGGGHRPWV